MSTIRARPLGRLLGIALPFTIFGGSTGDAGEKLVIDSGKHTFVRPLG